MEEGLGVSFKTVLKADQGWDRCFSSGFRQRHMGTTNSVQAPSAACNRRAGAFHAGQVGSLGLHVLGLPVLWAGVGRKGAEGSGATLHCPFHKRSWSAFVPGPKHLSGEGMLSLSARHHSHRLGDKEPLGPEMTE